MGMRIECEGKGKGHEQREGHKNGLSKIRLGLITYRGRDITYSDLKEPSYWDMIVYSKAFKL